LSVVTAYDLAVIAHDLASSHVTINSLRSAAGSIADSDTSENCGYFRHSVARDSRHILEIWTILPEEHISVGSEISTDERTDW
ncbi:hypothetical protein OY671_012556, partial [Metschnikowia pulcherrima]